ncbi:hypothetical protein BAUCODRAFT_34821 [Baudoinia panamericana UAMH 10762]|uniref:Glycosyltransferase family 31 protein n=1 Tax=Baudoinia panamericana (strain UAMH 10762) TaxID=717646 RepID=M2NAA3_BAUPA|nr:uncharacterized protein BAUCODRAFT_34821 [Baudoinia panamericana UAMH 10762]EMC96054.1 hypothetical protein BAUCODRAFT_34821 [Baudoinia panamericana UAMH 10762]
MSASLAYNLKGVTLLRLAIIFLILVGLFLYHDQWLPDNLAYTTQPATLGTPTVGHSTTSHEGNVAETSSSASGSCQDVPGADKVLVMLKTGATELYQKLPTHFVTTLTCVPHFMIFSDMAQDFAGYPIHDAIASVGKQYREHHGDFELYRRLQQYQREGQDMGKLKGDGGWNLDKWKFLPMLHQAFKSAPDQIQWFVMIEADTSVSWPNLLLWLKTMDPRKPYYLGAQNVVGDTTFGHGGSGLVFSRKAADLLVRKRESMGKEAYDEKWEELTSTSCCGDEVVARAFQEADVALTPAWPRIQGETVSTIDWTDNHWCSVAITWHHVTPIEVDSLFQFQMSWVDDHGWDTPYLFRDVFEHYIERHISVNRTNWNNICQDQRFISESLAGAEDTNFYDLEDYEQESVNSADACAAACARKREYECVQWMWSPGRCYLGKDIRLGRSDAPYDEHWTSGWMMDRVQAFKQKFEQCKVKWSG